MPLRLPGATGRRIMGQHGEEEGVSLNPLQEEKGGWVGPLPLSLRHHSSSGEPAGRIDNSMSGPAASFYRHHFTALALCTRKTPSLLSFNNPCGCFHALRSPSPPPPAGQNPRVRHLDPTISRCTFTPNVATAVVSKRIWPALEGWRGASGREGETEEKGGRV